jgi:hypothetical protein
LRREEAQKKHGLALEIFPFSFKRMTTRSYLIRDFFRQKFSIIFQNGGFGVVKTLVVVGERYDLSVFYQGGVNVKPILRAGNFSQPEFYKFANVKINLCRHYIFNFYKVNNYKIVNDPSVLAVERSNPGKGLRLHSC